MSNRLEVLIGFTDKVRKRLLHLSPVEYTTKFPYVSHSANPGTGPEHPHVEVSREQLEFLYQFNLFGKE